MKKIILFLLLFAALKVAGQTTGYLRFDTVRVMKQNGTCELYVINKTKDSLGLLTNVGGGLTQFKKSRSINDSTFVVGLDTITIRGTGGGSATVNNRFSVTKGTGDSLQLLNDQRSLNRNYSYTTLNDGTRKWNPSYWSFIDKYYADTATSTQTNVGGSSTVRLSNGSYLTAYTGFGSNPEDGGSSTIYAINSNDNLRTFNNKRQIVTLDTLEAHFGPSLYVKGTNLSTGDTIILIWATQINSTTNNYVGDIRKKVSNDGGATWGSETILHSGTGEYYNNFPNRIFKTNSGKLLYPFELLPPGSSEPGGMGVGWHAKFIYSTNNGTSWSSSSLPTVPDTGAVETGFYQRKGETRLFWYGRSIRTNYVHWAYSDDDGSTWTTPDYMNFSSGNAAVTIKYINELDCFLAFTNRVNGLTQADKRKYLNGFISYDGQNFKQFMCLDTALDNSAGVIGLSDIISTDSAFVVIYSFFHSTTNNGDMKVARIPRSHINSSFENFGSGIGIPSGSDADRISDAIPIFRKNVNSGFYEGSLGAGSGYGTFFQVGNSISSTYPFWQANLRSYSQSGRLNLINQDNNYNYNTIEFTKLFNNNGDLGEGTTGGAIGTNTMSNIRWITSANTTGGYSTFDETHWSTNAAGTNAERMRLTAEGRVGVGTDVPSAWLHIRAGTATAGTAPLKFTSGTPTTTPEIGSFQFNSGLFIIDSSNSKRDTIATRDWVRNNTSSSSGGITSINGETGSSQTIAAGTGINVATTTNTQTISIPTSFISSGTYTPTLTNGINVASTTAYLCKYVRIGSMVIVSGKIFVDFTSTGATEVGISLPISSSLSNDYDLTGSSSSGFNPGAAIYADPTNDRASLNITTSSSAGYDYYFTFMYQIL